MDKGATQPTGVGAIYDVTLNLSPMPTSDWTEIFNREWVSHFYMQKKNAEAFGSKILLQCTLDALGDGLLEQLKIVAAKTNTIYREHTGNVHEQNQAAHDSKMAERANVADVASKLKFD